MQNAVKNTIVSPPQTTLRSEANEFEYSCERYSWSEHRTSANISEVTLQLEQRYRFKAARDADGVRKRCSRGHFSCLLLWGTTGFRTVILLALEKSLRSMRRNSKMVSWVLRMETMIWGDLWEMGGEQWPWPVLAESLPHSARSSGDQLHSKASERVFLSKPVFGLEFYQDACVFAVKPTLYRTWHEAEFHITKRNVFGLFFVPKWAGLRALFQNLLISWAFHTQ